MKFLVLALCVCAASAASFTPYNVATAPVYAAQAAASVASTAAKTVAQPIVKAYNGASEAAAEVLRSDSDVTATGFNYVYETGNGIAAQASGALKRVGDVDFVASQGGYKYVAPDGTPVEVTYIADENGFQPQSSFIPVAPPVPEAIARALAYIAAHPPAPETVKKY